MPGAAVTSNPRDSLFAVSSGTFANRPTKSVNGRLYLATDKTNEDRFSVWIGGKTGGAWFAVPPLTFTSLLANTGDIVATLGDLQAVGGFKQCVGPWTITLAASQTNLGMVYGAVATVTAGWVAPTAGSLLYISGFLDAAITGAGTQAAFGVYKNGTIINASAICTFTQAGAETVNKATFAKDLYTFAAGDNLTIKYTSTAISNTPKAWVSMGVEC